MVTVVLHLDNSDIETKRSDINNIIIKNRIFN